MPSTEVVTRLFEGDGVVTVGQALGVDGGPAGRMFRFSGEQVLLDTFFDTADWRIRRAGLALRVRWGTPTTVVLERGIAGSRAASGPSVELEIPPGTEFSVESLAAAGPLGERVRALAGRHPIERHLDLRTRRAAYEGIEESAGARIVVDEVRIAGPPGPTGPAARRMEVSVGEDGAASLEAWLHVLAEGRELRSAAPLFDTTLRQAGLAPLPATDFGPSEIEPSVTIGALAFACLRRQALAFLRHEAGTRLGEDSEPLHDMRVAARRMRAALALFAPYLPARARALRRELGRLGRILGAVRDLDVQIEEMAAWRRAADPADAAAFDALDARLIRRRGIARRRLLAALDAARYERFVARLSAFLRHGPGRRPAAGRAPATAIAPELVRGAYRAVRKAGDAVTSASPPATYHRLRIRAKRLRYALEFHLPLYGDEMRAMIEGVTALQDLLGEHQDAVVAIEHLRLIAAVRRGSLPPHALFVMGAVAERYAHRAEALRRSFPAAFRRIRGRRWKRLRAALEAGASGAV